MTKIPNPKGVVIGLTQLLTQFGSLDIGYWNLFGISAKVAPYGLKKDTSCGAWNLRLAP
jgi:hypothetical protein